MTEPRDEARDVLAAALQVAGIVEPTLAAPLPIFSEWVIGALAARGYRLTPEPAPDVDALREAQATIEAMSGDAADLIDVMDEAAALRTALAHVLVRTHDSGCGTCDGARALLAAEHELPALGRTPEVETWDEGQAIRAAIHETAGRCRDGRFDHCYDQFHSPPIKFADWWPPADPSRREP